jgi:hypothetical protein
MKMIGFYVLRGHSHERLINLSETEKAVYMHWMEQYYEEEAAKLKALAGGK